MVGRLYKIGSCGVQQTLEWVEHWRCLAHISSSLFCLHLHLMKGWQTHDMFVNHPLRNCCYERW